MGIKLVEKAVGKLRVTLFPWLPRICSICVNYLISTCFYLLLEIPYYALGNFHSFEEEKDDDDDDYASYLLDLEWDKGISTDNSSCSSRDSEVHWLDLPDHIVSSHIANRLTRLKDFVQFGAVCRSWRSVYINSQHNRSSRVPFLMLATQLNCDEQTRSLYSIIDKRVICNSQVPIPHVMHCPGSSHGWVFIVCPKTLEIRLLNPLLSSAENEIHLPPITAFEHDRNDYAAPLLRKAVLSANPAFEPTNYFILAIDNGRYDSALSFYKPGDKVWTPIDSQFHQITDVIYYRENFYAVNNHGYVFSIDLNHPQPKVLTVALRPPRQIRDRRYLLTDRRYLVELSGEILQILRYYTDEDDVDEDFPEQYLTNGFDVFKLDQVNRKWILLDNLDRHILFLGDNSSLCVSASDSPECEPDSIYFTDDYYDLYTLGEGEDRIGPCDMGVFRFKDRTIQPHYPKESKSLYPAPIWVEPPPCT